MLLTPFYILLFLVLFHVLTLVSLLVCLSLCLPSCTIIQHCLIMKKCSTVGTITETHDDENEQHFL
jgi:hypothetical protein